MNTSIEIIQSTRSSTVTLKLYHEYNNRCALHLHFSSDSTFGQAKANHMLSLLPAAPLGGTGRNATFSDANCLEAVVQGATVLLCCIACTAF